MISTKWNEFKKATENCAQQPITFHAKTFYYYCLRVIKNEKERYSGQPEDFPAKEALIEYGRLCDDGAQNTVKIAKVRQMAARELLVKKFEFDKRVSTAELNRQREIQRRVQAIRRHHVIPSARALLIATGSSRT